MKLAIATDTHFGAREASLLFDDYFQRFYKEIFFPYLEKNEITNVLMMGDTFDKRKHTNNFILNRWKTNYFDVLRDRGITTTILVGNHDTYFKNTNRVNIISDVCREYENIDVVVDPKEKMFGDMKMLLLPWICDENYEQSMNFINYSDAKVVAGHLELNGFEMHRGYVMDHGMDYKIFHRFKTVMTGHYHHKSSKGNIHYLGSPYEITKHDFNDRRGFHVLDTETSKLTYVQNPLKMFHQFYYDDVNETLDQMKKKVGDSIKNTYVEIVVDNMTNPATYDKFINYIENVGVYDLKIKDLIDERNDEAIGNVDVNDVDDTRSTISQVIRSMDDTVNKEDLEDYLLDLHNKAVYVAKN